MCFLSGICLLGGLLISLSVLVGKFIIIIHIYEEKQEKKQEIFYACITHIYIYIYIYIVSHRSEYTPHIFVNILLYLFMWQH